jgi:hypothetical protein
MRALQARSQCDRILAHLVRGRPLTTLQAMHRFGCMRVSERIRELEKRGHQITHERVKVGEKNVARYRLCG